jgi:hypothetical protein
LFQGFIKCKGIGRIACKPILVKDLDKFISSKCVVEIKGIEKT